MLIITYLEYFRFLSKKSVIRLLDLDCCCFYIPLPMLLTSLMFNVSVTSCLATHTSNYFISDCSIFVNKVRKLVYIMAFCIQCTWNHVDNLLPTITVKYLYNCIAR